MRDESHRAIGIERCDCITALGDTQETHRRLLAGEVALRRRPVLGQAGNDEVPLATIGSDYEETLPARWQAPLDRLLAKAPSHPWGSPRYPVFLSSSNYDVGSLYAYRMNGDSSYLRLGTPSRTLEWVRQRYAWGPHAIALSHACVTAHLAVEMAGRYLRQGLADKALIVSFDFISPFVAGGFHALKILNGQMPAPYQDREVGSIGLGDGAAFLVVALEDAPMRIQENFLFNEMYHFTSNEPGGSGFKASADWAASAAGETRLWIKGHGTGTLEAGRLESQAFQGRLPDSPLVSWKGSLGHTLGSCGLVELAIALESARHGWAPGTVGLDGPAFAETVATSPIDTTEYQGMALFSNAFGGAHGGCIVRYG